MRKLFSCNSKNIRNPGVKQSVVFPCIKDSSAGMKTSRLAQNLQTGMLFLALVVSQFAGQPTESSSGKESQQMITAGNSQIFFNVEDGPLSVSKADLAVYVRDAAKAVTAYYGTFPIHKTVINFVPSDDDGIGFGTSTYDDDEDYGVVTINIGENTTRRNLRSSWTLTHELMHLAFPVVSHHKRWLSEGIATYVEPIGRMRIGNLSPEEVWGDLLTNLPKGLPRQGEGGLRSARNFDRIYWGGALYCLLADVEIRQRTNNRVGLEDALRSIAKQGGTAASNWDAEEAVQAGDKGLGISVLHPLYTKMGEQPVSIDVPAYLRKLGVVKSGETVAFDDRAPLAAIRHAIDGSE